MGNGKDKQTRLVGTPDALKGACPVWGALDGNLLPQDSKALSFDSIQRDAWQPSARLGQPSGDAAPAAALTGRPLAAQTGVPLG